MREAALFGWGDTLVEYQRDDAIVAEGTRAASAPPSWMTAVRALWFRADDSDAVEPDYRAFTMHDVLNVVRRLRAES